MTVIALVSAKGAPGVSTSSLALASAWSSDQPSMVTEVDMDGGDMAAVCGLSVEGNGLLSLSISGRRADAEVDVVSHCQMFGSTQLPVLTAPAEPPKVAQALDMLGNRLLPELQRTGRTVFLDTGRLRPSEPTGSLLARADMVLIVARPTVVQAAAIEARSSILRSLGPDVAVLLVGDKPYGAAEFSEAVGFDVIGTLPSDQRGTDALVGSHGSFGMRRSLVMRAANDIVGTLRARLGQRSEVAQ